MKKTLLFIMLSLLVVIAFACSNDDSGPQEENVEGEVTYRDEIKIAVTAQPPTLDSALTVSNVALGIALNIFETLYTLDENYEPTPMLAESLAVSDDGKTYTFQLREGVLFHNGKEMTAEDVVASMNRWLEKSSRAQSLLSGASFEEIDPYTVQLNLGQPSTDALIIMSSRSNFPAIMPAEIIESAPAEGVKEYVGTGPFQFNEWQQDQYIHLVKYENYQPVDLEPSGFAGKKEAFVNDVYFHFVTDHSTRIAGIQTGEYDIANDIPTESYELLSNMNGVNVHTFVGGTLTMFFNTNEGPLATVDMRQALNTALNMDEILLASYVHESLYSLDPTYMNPNQEQWATDAGSEFYNQGDLEKAQTMLEEAGYNGEEITLLTTSDYLEMSTATTVVAEQLRQLGMNVKIDNYDFPTFLERKNDFSNWDIFITSNGYQLTPPQILALTPSWAGLNNETISQLLVEIRSADSPELAREKWVELQGYMYEYLSSTAIGQFKNILAASDKLEDFVVFEAPIIWNTKVIE